MKKLLVRSWQLQICADQVQLTPSKFLLNKSEISHFKRFKFTLNIYYITYVYVAFETASGSVDRGVEDHHGVML
jgi:hypothetical protein